jgi:hypothetical protein
MSKIFREFLPGTFVVNTEGIGRKEFDRIIFHGVFKDGKPSLNLEKFGCDCEIIGDAPVYYDKRYGDWIVRDGLYTCRALSRNILHKFLPPSDNFNKAPRTTAHLIKKYTDKVIRIDHIFKFKLYDRLNLKGKNVIKYCTLFFLLNKIPMEMIEEIFGHLHLFEIGVDF